MKFVVVQETATEIDVLSSTPRAFLRFPKSAPAAGKHQTFKGDVTPADTNQSADADAAARVVTPLLSSKEPILHALEMVYVDVKFNYVSARKVSSILPKSKSLATSKGASRQPIHQPNFQDLWKSVASCEDTGPTLQENQGRDTAVHTTRQRMESLEIEGLVRVNMSHR